MSDPDLNAGLIQEIGILHKELAKTKEEVEVLRQAVFQLVTFVKTIQERLLQIGGSGNE